MVIDKNNMKKLMHFTDLESVMNYLWGKLLKDIIIIINETTVFHPASVGSGDISKIRYAIRKKLDELMTTQVSTPTTSSNNSVSASASVMDKIDNEEFPRAMSNFYTQMIGKYR